LNPDIECAPCTLKWIYERAEVLADEESRFQLSRSILRALSQEFCSDANLGSVTNKVIDVIDDFKSYSAEYFEFFKFISNQHARELLSAAKLFITKGETGQEKFVRACCLASASNIAPIGGPPETFKFQDVIDIILGKNPLPIVMGDVFEAAKKAKQILYLADNAGEIGFDSLLIAYLKELGSKVTLIVKKDPFFEDATMKDASFFHLDRSTDGLATASGFFVPNESPSSLTDSFKESDLVISKGTGNYEALKDEIRGKTAIFMLKVKCKPIAMKIGVNVGSFVVKVEK